MSSTNNNSKPNELNVASQPPKKLFIIMKPEYRRKSDPKMTIRPTMPRILLPGDRFNTKLGNIIDIMTFYMTDYLTHDLEDPKYQTDYYREQIKTALGSIRDAFINSKLNP